jgi:hypothetical protein
MTVAACRAADEPRCIAASAGVLPHDVHADGSCAGTDRPPSLCRYFHVCSYHASVTVARRPCIDSAASLATHAVHYIVPIVALVFTSPLIMSCCRCAATALESLESLGSTPSYVGVGVSVAASPRVSSAVSGASLALACVCVCRATHPARDSPCGLCRHRCCHMPLITCRGLATPCLCRRRCITRTAEPLPCTHQPRRHRYRTRRIRVSPSPSPCTSDARWSVLCASHALLRSHFSCCCHLWGFCLHPPPSPPPPPPPPLFVTFPTPRLFVGSP